MKEKFVMTSLMAGAFADVGTTMIALNNGFREVGVFGSVMYERGDMTAAYVTRMAVTAVMIGLYALSKQKGGSYEFVMDRTARITNILTWGIAALNAVQLAGLPR